jgi:polar amino acid transport system permease protein
LIKDTGLVSILGVTDAVRAAQIEASRTFNYTPYVVAAILFLIITVPLTRYTDRVLQRSIGKQNAQGAA